MDEEKINKKIAKPLKKFTGFLKFTEGMLGYMWMEALAQEAYMIGLKEGSKKK